ncbi:MAG: thiol:disulfide interchange protein DsbA/DsbL [Pseudomonadales bacterium]|jgi:thiol:disulfide interchange protein DsbA|nr:thiol:disulfide interchange protein DsbA/DsbL [Pseudomonadales bacterium]MDP7594651.1 thiol:disulfide interchange protein DsbA/DsbL [Pseudomonadales bacterium]HJN49733.1 thiol:disulfide interchange protein DsbA/DsbL [Pseudomonadales bacterium]|tara:strand:+ start:579 stop:1277 length:699 start_codon:yes stop_codon:yes gene_type:complete
MAKKQSKVLLYQKVAVAIGLAVVAVIVIYVSTIVVTDIPMGEYQLGVHYEEVENPRRLRGDKIEVMEFFSYGCIHCYNLDSDLDTWIEKNSDKVNFIRSPAMFNDSWRILAQSYYTTEALGITAQIHPAFFHEIQIRKTSFNSLEKLASYFDGKGTTSAEYKTAYNSPTTKRVHSAADERQRRYRVSSVPTMVVNGKYRVKTNAKIGLSRLLDIVDYLVEQELAKKTKPGNA